MTATARMNHHEVAKVDIPKIQAGRRVDDQRTMRIEKKLDDFSNRMDVKFDQLAEATVNLARVETHQQAVQQLVSHLQGTVSDLQQEVSKLKDAATVTATQRKDSIAGKERLWWVVGLTFVAGMGIIEHFLGVTP